MIVQNEPHLTIPRTSAQKPQLAICRPILQNLAEFAPPLSRGLPVMTTSLRVRNDMRFDHFCASQARRCRLPR